MESLIMPYGENGITFTLFNELDFEQGLKRLLSHTLWQNNEISRKLKKEHIERVYLFPSFGKRYGPGEPDAIITTKNYNIFFELETEPIDKKFNHIKEQLERFISIGNDLKNCEVRRIRKSKGFSWREYSKITGETKTTRGKFRNRKIFKDLLCGKNSLYIIITDDNVDKAWNIIKNLPGYANNVGFINYKKIKKMKGLSKTGKVINFNLRK